MIISSFLSLEVVFAWYVVGVLLCGGFDCCPAFVLFIVMLFHVRVDGCGHSGALVWSELLLVGR